MLALAWVLTGLLRTTVLAVTRGASAEGSAFLAHTHDATAPTDLRLVRVPAMRHAPNTLRNVYAFAQGYPRLAATDRGIEYYPRTGQVTSEPLGAVPQVEHTYAYFDHAHGLMNEVQLAIAQSSCPARTVGRSGTNLFSIAELTKAALERCDSARCAISTMGYLAETHGFYG
ncbi:peptidase [Achlya hypogyna]|uniref:Peptidase n=1 Tax=Achlya hypogyna TaxID=1202772 RepID=A0A1V9Z3T7_ACHHY|nr:peptidase [Achlya hypogyna]